MNDARFCMRLPQAALDFAQGYASQCQMSVTDLFLGYLNRLQESVAAKCAYIITRNKRDFAKSPVPALTPGEFLTL